MIKMTKQMQDWIKLNCENCSFRGKDKSCLRKINKTLKDMYKIYKDKKDCPLAEYEEVNF